MPRKNGIDVKLVVVYIDEGLGNAIKTQITPRKTRTNLAVESSNGAYRLLKTNVRS